MTDSLVLFEDFKICTMDEEERKELIQDNLGEGGFNPFDLDMIKSPSGESQEWRLPDISNEKGYILQDELVGIIIGWRDKRLYWEKEYGEGEASEPDCQSDDLTAGEGTPGGDCANCEYSQWESGKNGVGQACKVVRELVMLRPDKTLPCVVRIGPGSIRNIQKYFTDLVSIEKPYWKVVTALGLVSTKSKGDITYPKVTPRMAEIIDDEQLDVVRGCRQSMSNDK